MQLIQTNLQKIVYSKFKQLPLKYKFFIFAKLKYGNDFRPQDNDLFEVNRKLASKIYNDFINDVKLEYNS